jgi:hypothetical protein
MLRRKLVCLTKVVVAAWLLALPTPRASAQGIGAAAGLGFPNGGVDPFSIYYGYYLPHQAAVAAQPSPLDTINQVTAARQFAAITERTGLYDPISPYGEEELDPNRSFSARRGREHLAAPYAFPISPSNVRGTGPALYYRRTARYYPQLRTGQGANRNIAVSRRSGGGMGMPNTGGGFAGPR